MLLRLLSLIPIIGVIGGAAFVNRVTPFVFGMPLVLAWMAMWLILTSVCMGVVYLLDPANKAGGKP
jgi:hypothetical protein